MFSALPSTTDIKATYVSLVPIGRLVALDPPKWVFFGLRKAGILRTKEGHRSGADTCANKRSSRNANWQNAPVSRTRQFH
jgi:hypothetical protein